MKSPGPLAPNVQLAFKLCVVICFFVLEGSSFKLAILHTNDVHSRYQQTNKYSGSCSEPAEKEGKCYGGIARLQTKVQELRQKYPNSVLLDGGDQYQGTVWFYRYGGNVTAHFMQALGYDVMALGNHEFDLGPGGLIPLMEGTNFSIVSSNINASAMDNFQGRLKKSVVLTIGGQKVGFVGYTTVDTADISSPGNVTFNDEVESVRAEVERLTSEGVNKIVCLGHAGFLKDKELARNVSGIDVIVGGHTNTFLYSGEPPSNEDPLGDYPTVVEHADGTKVLVVQDYAYGKYLGFLQVEFNDDGKVTNWTGNPILLDNSVPQDVTMKADVAKWQKGVDEETKKVIGRTVVQLQAQREQCRLKECSMGNLVTDAMVMHTLRPSEGTEWNHVAIAITNGGGIRASLNPGDITLADAMTVLPFRNTIDIMEITGSTLLKTLEFSASLWDPVLQKGGFLQFSGIRVVYDIAPPEGGSRVKEVKVRCADCLVPTFVDLELSKVYKVVISGFLAKGGDKYSFLAEEAIKHHLNGDLDVEVFTSYVEKFSPIVQGLEGRIRFVNGTEEELEEDRKKEALYSTWEEERQNRTRETTDPTCGSVRLSPLHGALLLWTAFVACIASCRFAWFFSS